MLRSESCTWQKKSYTYFFSKFIISPLFNYMPCLTTHIDFGAIIIIFTLEIFKHERKVFL